MPPVTRDPELERFKVEIDLRAYAVGQGYEIDRKESWRGSTMMRHRATDDKIVVSRDIDWHYVYFSVRKPTDNGSIIDFVLNLKGGSLRDVRMELRPWIGRKADASPEFKPLERRTQDRLAVDKVFWRMKAAPDHPYLTGERCIPPALLASERFADRVRIDDRGNAIFPHVDQGGLCGYEIKNRGYTGFARGGSKGLWFSQTDPLDTGLVIAESAIDALSFAGLFPAPATRYASTGGKMNPKQPELVTATVKRLRSGATVIAATDNDAGGAELAEALRLAVLKADRPDLMFTIRQPDNLDQDWNDVLKTQPLSFPTGVNLAADQA